MRGSIIFFQGLYGPRIILFVGGGGGGVAKAYFGSYYYVKLISLKFPLGLGPATTSSVYPRLTWRLTKSCLFLSLAVDGGEVWGRPGGLQTGQTVGGHCLLSDPERSVSGTVHWCGGNKATVVVILIHSVIYSSGRELHMMVFKL